MTTNRIGDIVSQLHVEETELQKKLDKFKREAKSTEGELSKVRKAIASLSPRSAGSEPNQKTTASKEEILSITAEVLETGPKTRDELKSLVQKRVSSNGRSLTGFAMRFSGVLKDARFVELDGSIALKEQSARTNGRQAVSNS